MIKHGKGISYCKRTIQYLEEIILNTGNSFSLGTSAFDNFSWHSAANGLDEF
jgi:hypothetical protein